MWRLLLLGLFLFSGVAYADSDSSWDYFQVDTSNTTKDLSVQYLISIFGAMGNVLSADTPNIVTTFGEMFSAFNIIALGIGVTMITYTVALGILNTAESGKFLGEKLSSIWIPIRTAVGTALLVPAAGPGYCMAQLIMMWLILNGVGAANTVWDFAVNNFTVSPVGVPGNNPTTAEMDAGYSMLYSMMKSEACARIEMGRSTGSGTISRVAFPASNLSSGSSTNYSIYYSDTPNVPNNICGQYTFPLIPSTNFSQTEGSALQIKQREGSYGMRQAAFGYMDLSSDAYPGSLPTAPGSYLSDSQAQRTIATYIGLATGYPAPPPGLAFPEGGTAVYNTDWAPYIDAARSWVYWYVHNIKTEQAAGIPLSDPTTSENSSAERQKLTEKGWLSAGFYYFNLVAMTPPPTGSGPQYMVDVTKLKLPGTSSNSARIPADTASSPDPAYLGARNRILYLMSALNPGAVHDPAPSTVENLNDPMLTYGRSVEGSYAGAASNAPQTSATNSLNLSNQEIQTFVANVVGDNRAADAFSNSAAKTIFQSLRQSWTDVMAGFTAAFSKTQNNGDPLVALMQMGSMMMVKASDGVLTLMIVVPIMGLISGVCTSQLPFGELIQAVLSTVIPVLYLLYGILYTEGALLGVYLPMIPLISFVVGGLGWFTAVIEAMVAAPIIAVALTIPEGQHDILGRAEPAFMMVLNLMLRPVLMVIGFVTAIFLLRVAISFVTVGFIQVYSSGGIQADYLFGPIVILGAYVAIVVSVVQRVFGLITHLPDRALSWIGDHSAGYGNADQMLGEAKAASKEQAGTLGKTEGMVKQGGKMGKQLGKDAMAAGKMAKGKTEGTDTGLM